MRMLLLMLLFIVSFGSTAITTESPKLVVLGDSLSAAYGIKQEQGWVSLLQNTMNDGSVIIVNAAISGDTTAGGRARLPSLLAEQQPSHLLIELGGNDGLQGYPLDEMEANLSAMIEYAQHHQINVILQEMQIPTNYGRRYTQMFNAVYARLAEQYEIPLIPFFLEEIALDSSMMQSDGIHPNAKAQPLIRDFMFEKLIPLLTE